MTSPPGAAALERQMRRLSQAAALRLAVAASTALFLVLAATTGRRIGPSGDGAQVWAAEEPLRSVLCVETAPDSRGRPRLHVAADPSDADIASLDADLVSAQHRLGNRSLSVVSRDHAYRATVEVFGLSVPWMLNEYGSAVAEWPHALAARLSARPFGAGRALTFVWGALVVALAAWLAGQAGGPWAAGLGGSILATDVWFHYYKRLLAGPEALLQLAAVGTAAFLVLAHQRRAPRFLAAAAFTAAVGIHIKPSFAAVAGVLAAGALIMAPWGLFGGREGRRRLLRASAGVLLAAAAGLAPTLGWVALRQGPLADVAEYGMQETAADRLHEVSSNLRGTPEGAAEPAAFAPKRGVGPLDLYARPTVPLRQHLSLRDHGANDALPARAQQSWSPPSIPAEPTWLRASRGSVWLLGFLALLGGLAAARRDWTSRGPGERSPRDDGPRIAWWLVGIACVLPPAIRRLHPDMHHLALWIPFGAVAVGAGAGRLLATPWAGRVPGVAVAVGVLLTLSAAGARIHDLRQVDGALVTEAGRLLDADAQRALAATLDALDDPAPAVLEYELMALIEGWTDSRVRPWLYGRSALAGDRPDLCSAADEPRWLEAILQAHAGHHLVVAAGPRPGQGEPTTWFSDPTVLRAASRARVRVRREERLADDRGRWTATVWSVESIRRPTSP